MSENHIPDMTVTAKISMEERDEQYPHGVDIRLADQLGELFQCKSDGGKIIIIILNIHPDINMVPNKGSKFTNGTTSPPLAGIGLPSLSLAVREQPAQKKKGTRGEYIMALPGN